MHSNLASMASGQKATFLGRGAMSEFSFNPDVELSYTEKAALTAIMVHPGFEIWQKISRSCVDQFVTHLLASDDNNDKEIITRYRMSKIAAQLYTMQMNKMFNAKHEYLHAQDNDKPVDSAQGLDFGLTAEQEIQMEDNGAEESLFA
jgi:hypothetical protein